MWNRYKKMRVSKVTERELFKTEEGKNCGFMSLFVQLCRFFWSRETHQFNAALFKAVFILVPQVGTAKTLKQFFLLVES